jgi:hypothetical protein
MCVCVCLCKWIGWAFTSSSEVCGTARSSTDYTFRVFLFPYRTCSELHEAAIIELKHVCYIGKGCFADFTMRINLGSKNAKEFSQSIYFYDTSFLGYINKSLPVCCKSANNCVQQDQNSSQTTPQKIGQRHKQEMFLASR